MQEVRVESLPDLLATAGMAHNLVSVGNNADRLPAIAFKVIPGAFGSWIKLKEISGVGHIHHRDPLMAAAWLVEGALQMLNSCLMPDAAICLPMQMLHNRCQVHGTS